LSGNAHFAKLSDDGHVSLAAAPAPLAISLRWSLRGCSQTNRVQLTSDGHKAYLEAVEGAFGSDIDYAMLVKLYGEAPESAKRRYSPAECTGCMKQRIEGNPDPRHVSTSYAERQNLNVRMHIRRFIGSRMHSARRSRTTRIRSRYSRCATISFASIKRCGQHLRWRLASRRGFGRLVISWTC
jgi:hypothetical protein